MAHIYKKHRYAATFDGKNPAESTRYVEADSVPVLDELIAIEGYDPNEAQYYYKLHIEAETAWGKIDGNTDYQDLLAKLTREFRKLGGQLFADTPITTTHTPEPVSFVSEEQADWDSDDTI